MSAPDFEGMDPQECFAFWVKYQRGRRAAELFPDKPVGYRKATAALANYAANIGTAKGCRLRGETATALTYEAIAQRIYDSLPGFARW